MINKCVGLFIPLVDAIAETLGKSCEVVLHDFTKPHQSIVKIANGHITGRKVGGAASLTLSSLKKLQKNDSVIGYRSRTNRGTELKSTTMFIRDHKGKIVGALCINIDITPYISIKNLSDEFCSRSELTVSDSEAEKGPHETFEITSDNVVNDLVNELLEQSTRKIGQPIYHMRKKDKMEIMRELRENGVFLIKGSAKKVAQTLNVSLATIYKYLEEIQ